MSQTQPKFVVKVVSYDEGTDEFELQVLDVGDHMFYLPAAPYKVPGLFLPALIGGYGEPHELVGRSFVVKMP